MIVALWLARRRRRRSPVARHHAGDEGSRGDSFAVVNPSRKREASFDRRAPQPSSTHPHTGFRGFEADADDCGADPSAFSLSNPGPVVGRRTPGRSLRGGGAFARSSSGAGSAARLAHNPLVSRFGRRAPPEVGSAGSGSGPTNGLSPAANVANSGLTTTTTGGDVPADGTGGGSFAMSGNPLFRSTGRLEGPGGVTGAAVV